MGNSERDVIRRVLAGEVDAYRALMDRHFAAVLQMSYRITGRMEDAEEAAQEAFLRAYNKLPDFREQAAFGTWVYRIGMNCALNLVERRSRDPGWKADPDAWEQMPAAGENPEAVLLRAEQEREQERLLGCLSPMERAAFVLRHMEEQPAAEIAAALGITPNTARQTVFRAVAKLRREMAPGRQAERKDCAAKELNGSHDEAF